MWWFVHLNACKLTAALETLESQNQMSSSFNNSEFDTKLFNLQVHLFLHFGLTVEMVVELRKVSFFSLPVFPMKEM